jgi:predicted metal-dependent HD superfamily phosphohydrolase
MFQTDKPYRNGRRIMDDEGGPDFRTASASLRRNGCFDYTQKDPKALKGLLEQAWETMVVEAFGLLLASPRRRDVAGRWFDRLWTLHANDPKRHYHTVVHLWEMTKYLMLLVKEKDLSCDGAGANSSNNNDGGIPDQQRNAIFLAIFFHDAVYDPQSSTNEEDSALLFQEFASEAGLDVSHRDVAQQVTQFIIATKHHQVTDSNPTDLALFLDMDMAVLGKDADAYVSYAGLIRKEYLHVPPDVYCAKRADVLEAFLEQPRIYGTRVVRHALETQARDNLKAEIAALRSGIIYGEADGVDLPSSFTQS